MFLSNLLLWMLMQNENWHTGPDFMVFETYIALIYLACKRYLAWSVWKIGKQTSSSMFETEISMLFPLYRKV
jgi:hypothetical protein